MAMVNPYLNFSGDCADAFAHYAKVFGTEVAMTMKFSDAPPEFPSAPEESDWIMHIALPIGSGTMLMGSDVPGSMGRAEKGTAFYVSVSCSSEDEARRVFDGLAAGGQVIMPLEWAFWGDLFGMLKDRFGVQWMVGYGPNHQQ